jgi:hypothetical protein
MGLYRGQNHAIFRGYLALVLLFFSFSSLATDSKRCQTLLTDIPSELAWTSPERLLKDLQFSPSGIYLNSASFELGPLNQKVPFQDVKAKIKKSLKSTTPLSPPESLCK